MGDVEAKDEIKITLLKSEYDYLKEFETLTKSNKSFHIERGYYAKDYIIIAGNIDEKLKDIIYDLNQVIKKKERFMVEYNDKNVELIDKLEKLEGNSILNKLKFWK